MITPSGSGGAVDERLEGLPTAVTDLLRTPVVARHVDKLARHADLDERHLFIAIGPDGIPTSTYMGMMDTPVALPCEAPEVPDAVTHLWLTTGYGRWLFAWSREHGWQSYEVLV